MVKPFLIKSENFSDNRGLLRAFNSFDMNSIQRVYHICPLNTDDIRAWQFHEKESKAFQVIKGKFMLNILELKPYKPEVVYVHSFQLDAASADILIVPPGFANGIKALLPDSIIQVFSNKTLEESKNDDKRFPVNKFNINWKE